MTETSQAWVVIQPNDSEDESIVTISEELTDEEIINESLTADGVSETENVTEEFNAVISESVEFLKQDDKTDLSPIEIILVIFIFSSFFVPLVITGADFLNVSDALFRSHADSGLDKKYLQEHNEVLTEHLKLLRQANADLQTISIPPVIESKTIEEEDLIKSWVKITSNIKTDIVNLNKKISHFILKNSLNLKTDISKICDENECKAKKSEIFELINNGIKNSIFSWTEFAEQTIESDLSKISNYVITGQESLINIMKCYQNKTQTENEQLQGKKNGTKSTKKAKKLKIKSFDNYYNKIIKKLKNGNFRNLFSLKFRSRLLSNATNTPKMTEMDNDESYWFFNIAKHRQDKRLEHTRGDWFFNRAMGRRKLANYY